MMMMMTRMTMMILIEIILTMRIIYGGVAALKI